MDILKYIDKKIKEIENQRNDKENRIYKIKKEIKKLENKINSETEKEGVIIKGEATIKVLKNKMKIIELETIEELDKGYIKEEAEKEIQKLSSDLKIKNKKILEKAYYLLKEMAENQEEAKEIHSNLRSKLYANQVQGHFSGQFEQGGRLRDLSMGKIEIKSNKQGVYLEKNIGFGTINKLSIYEEDFKIK